VQFFIRHGGNQLHTFASYALPCQTPFCQTAPLLSSVARQQNLVEYWQEGSASTAISPASASDVMGQHNKIGGIDFGATLVLFNLWICPQLTSPWRMTSSLLKALI
jgi:hypothetical protein